MYRINLREYKTALRQKEKEYRFSLSADKKQQMDRAVFQNVLKSRQYKQLDTVFIYVSTAIEVDTRFIIKNALETGKKVAVPKCIPETCEMVFHYINSFSDLHPGSFSVDEPDEILPIATYHEGTFMIVPALLIDRKGYRIGYGKGYYDRYIEHFHGQTVGLCYDHGFMGQIHHGKFDFPMDTVVTQTTIYSPGKTIRRGI